MFSHPPKDQERRTPLHAAAYIGDVAILELLILSGANVNAKDTVWLTPLHRAAASRHEVGALGGGCSLGVWWVLLDMGWAGMSGTWGGQGHGVAPLTLPHTPQMVNLLLNKGASPSTCDRKDRQPLHWAAFLGRCSLLVSPPAPPLQLSHPSVHLSSIPSLHLSYSEPFPFPNPQILWILLIPEIEEPNSFPLGAARIPGCCRQLWGSSHLPFPFPNPQIPRIPWLPQIDEPNSFGNTALHIACYMGQDAVANELVNVGANVNQPNEKGFTPLHFAAVSTNGALCLEILVNNGADVNFQSKEGKSPLHMAAIHGRFTRSQILIQNGGRTALAAEGVHVAARYGHELLISTLMTNGADTARRGIHDMFPLHLAVLFGFSDCCRKLLSSGQLYSIVSSLSNEHVLSAGFDINTPDNLGRTCLHAAASGGNVECLNLLLSSGADLRRRDKFGSALSRPPPPRATRQNLELLLEMSFNCLEDVESSVPVSPLHLAAYNGHCEALKALAETLVNLDVRDHRGRTALYLATERGGFYPHPSFPHPLFSSPLFSWSLCPAANGNTDSLHLLIDSGERADITDVMDIHGQRAAVSCPQAVTGCEDCLAALLDHDAFVLCRDFKGRTPIHFASACGHLEVLRTLLQAALSTDPLDSVVDYSGYSPMHWASYSGHEDCLELLLEHNPFAYLEGNPFTPLHCAVINNQDGTAEMLVEALGAKIVNSRDAKGRTPLHAAAFADNVHGLQLLLRHQAEVDTADKLGRTPLMVASENGHTAAVEFLLFQAKANITVLDVNKNTALHLACSKGHEKCALLILGETQDLGLINASNSALQMPLHIAARNGLASVVQAVPSRGATVLAVDEEGACPWGHPGRFSIPGKVPRAWEMLSQQQDSLVLPAALGRGTPWESIPRSRGCWKCGFSLSVLSLVLPARLGFNSSLEKAAAACGSWQSCNPLDSERDGI
ncbi:PREDICTED: serine/threonine-protein phosphatase 6 regulatory ankyrin repeat subunit C-like [Corvus brachyrhynchos]|uniref:serine/threonine-protein phosphatase 6 regulatory ankyrin repeat subunit C-like n=1 Tax=Corvus brachyrhynchos TaxID=85066 RepID=UPI0008164BF3|nr:PREDICTED: serine/threonine-protein phosphatase 6 regulatory ankyrin repeat subunit C-like [Corvus brachyrhynchos]